MEEGTDKMAGFGEPAPGAARAGLILLYAPNFTELPAVFALTGEAAVIGREPPPGGLRIQQQAVSRVHARIVLRHGTWEIADLGSRNGTLVNGVFVQTVALKPNDEVRTGDAIFKFIDDEADAFATFRLDGEILAPGQARGGGSADLVGGLRMSRITDEIATIAPTPLSVLILGETGTGKEIVASALHRASRRSGRFCALNCAALPSNLFESELFGFKRGAFTGADRDRPGIVRAAHGGTLFLDEIGDMALDSQAKLLRMLETREVVPLGATVGEKVDVRVVCATHRNLGSYVEEGRFRGDLFARINGYTLNLPPLRERKEDIYMLVRHFLDVSGRRDLRVSFPFMTSLFHHSWPYNVRELESAVRRCVAVADAPELEVRHLPQIIVDLMRDYGHSPQARDRKADRATNPSLPVSVEAPPSGTTLTSPPSSLTAAATPTEPELRALLAEHRGNVAAVARDLNKDRAQIHRWMRYHGIAPDDYRE